MTDIITTVIEVDVSLNVVDGASGVGAAGAPGSVIRNGSSAPSNGLGINGDYYINTTTDDLYFKASGVYTIVANLKGNTGATGSTGSQGTQGLQGIPGTDGATGATGATGAAGATGATGSAGANGADGKTVLSGTGVPSSGLGTNGDFYIDTASHNIYGPKASGSWPSGVSLIGPAGSTGATGATGSTGAKGDTGDVGPTGPTGSTGPTGATGSSGSAGANGATWYSGTSAPSGGTGINGDFYFRTSTGDVYNKVSGSWGSPVVNLTGPTGATGSAGATGPTGATGSAGANGATWYSGTTVPSDGSGVNGDFYFRTTTGDVYTKASGTWGSPVVNLTGPTGATGATGSTGAAGPSNVITESSGPTNLAVGAISNGQFLKRSGSTAVGATLAAIAASGDAADLSGTLSLARFGTQNPNLVIVGPSDPLASAAAPTFRRLNAFDMMGGQYGVRLFEDFTASTLVGNTNVGSAAAGTGAAVAADNTFADANHPGVIKVSTGTVAATGSAVLRHAVSTFLLGGGEFVFDAMVYIPTLSNGTTSFTALLGMGTGSAADQNDHVNGVYFRHDATTGNWICVCSAASTRTSTTSSIAVVAGAWTHLRWIANAGATSVAFYVGTTLAATITTNIPVSSGQQIAPNFKSFLTVGSTNRDVYVDLFDIAQLFTSPRW